MGFTNFLKTLGLHRRKRPLLTTPKDFTNYIGENYEKDIKRWEDKLAGGLRGAGSYAQKYEVDRVREILQDQVRRAYNEDPYGIKGSLLSRVDDWATDIQSRGRVAGRTDLFFLPGEENVGKNPVISVLNTVAKIPTALIKTLAATGELFFYGIRNPKRIGSLAAEIPLSAASLIYSGIDSTGQRIAQSKAISRIRGYMDEAINIEVNNRVRPKKTQDLEEKAAA